MTDACAICRFYRATYKDRGACHRRAPTRSAGPEQWPTVRDDAWCGEFEGAGDYWADAFARDPLRGDASHAPASAVSPTALAAARNLAALGFVEDVTGENWTHLSEAEIAEKAEAIQKTWEAATKEVVVERGFDNMADAARALALLRQQDEAAAARALVDDTLYIETRSAVVPTTTGPAAAEAPVDDEVHLFLAPHEGRATLVLGKGSDHPAAAAAIEQRRLRAEEAQRLYEEEMREAALREAARKKRAPRRKRSSKRDEALTRPMTLKEVMALPPDARKARKAAMQRLSARRYKERQAAARKGE